VTDQRSGRAAKPAEPASFLSRSPYRATVTWHSLAAQATGAPRHVRPRQVQRKVILRFTGAGWGFDTLAAYQAWPAPAG